MARFVDRAALFDVEIVDNTLFLYTGPGISTVNPEVWTWLFELVTALQSKVDSWTRWRDDRLAQPAALPSGNTVPVSAAIRPPSRPPGVAIEGRRLRRRGPRVLVLIGFLSIGAFWYLISTV